MYAHSVSRICGHLPFFLLLFLLSVLTSPPPCHFALLRPLSRPAETKKTHHPALLVGMAHWESERQWWAQWPWQAPFVLRLCFSQQRRAECWSSGFGPLHSAGRQEGSQSRGDQAGILQQSKGSQQPLHCNTSLAAEPSAPSLPTSLPFLLTSLTQTTPPPYDCAGVVLCCVVV